MEIVTIATLTLIGLIFLFAVLITGFMYSLLSIPWEGEGDADEDETPWEDS